MKEHLPVLVISVPSLQDFKSQIKSLQNKLIKKSRSYTETLRNSVRKNVVSGETQESGLRKCAKCGEEKPLDKDHYQVVKYFKSNFSYYCNCCNEYVKPRD